MSRKTQGGISHSICIAYFLSIGSVVSFPLFDDAPYDLLVDDSNDILKIQCKTATGNDKYKSGKAKYPRIGLNVDKHHKPTFTTSFDYMWVMSREFCYLIPSIEIPHDESGMLRSFVISRKYSSFIVNLPFPSGKEPERPMSPSPMTESEIERATVLFDSGETYRTIGKIMGLPDYKVQYYLQKGGLRRNNYITPEEKLKIVDLYSSGMSVNEIAIQYDRSKSAVAKIVKNAGLSTKEPVVKPEWKPEIIEMYRNGATPLEIAQKFGIKRPNSISTFLHRQKWLVNASAESIVLPGTPNPLNQTPTTLAVA